MSRFYYGPGANDYIEDQYDILEREYPNWRELSKGREEKRYVSEDDMSLDSLPE